MVLSTLTPVQTFIILLFFFFNISYAFNDRITLSQSIAGSEKLASKGGKFELGYFQPGKSRYYYLGIWYSPNLVSQQTSVWVANRETPLTDISKTNLAISENGNLLLSNQTNPFIWSTNITHNTHKVVAVLLDTGNFVLRDASNPKVTLWQSFDHPTHTWLPGGKLGLNKVTKELQILTSWKNEDDPAPGIFSLKADPNDSGEYFILWNNSIKYWTSGSWNKSFNYWSYGTCRNGHIFSLVPVIPSNYIYNFNYISNDKEDYFTYTVKSDYALTSRFIMDLSGQIKKLTWVANSGWSQFWFQPRQQCDVHALCGPFGVCNEVVMPFCRCIKGFTQNTPSDWALSNWAGGCVRNTKLECGKDRFFTMPNTRKPDNPKSVQGGSASDCELNCLKDCSCTAYIYNSGGCFVWHGGLLNLQDQYNGPNVGTLFVRLAASELPIVNKNKMVMISNYVVSAIIGILLLFMVAWLVCYYRQKIAYKQKAAEVGLSAFRYSELLRATKNFSEKLGGGSFGSVFKGVLPHSTSSDMIAVKQLEGVRQGEKQFRTEVSTIGRIQHVNLVRLHGFCSEGLHKLLVYEYMPNGSLDNKLFNEDSNLDWKTRYQIMLGTARGLTYLHEECKECIVHCDIKPENILLDASFVPKVADFGMAKIIGRDFSRVLTTMRGTRGYLAPEWILGMAITAKADVYSYGMMLFEFISSKRNLKKLQESKISYFPSLAVSKMMEGDVMSLVDEKLKGGDISEEEVIRVCKVACWCIQEEGDGRPSMSQVVQMLEGVQEVSMPPIPRMLQILAENPEDTDLFSEFFWNGAVRIQSFSTSATY